MCVYICMAVSVCGPGVSHMCRGDIWRVGVSEPLSVFNLPPVYLSLYLSLSIYPSLFYVSIHLSMYLRTYLQLICAVSFLSFIRVRSICLCLLWCLSAPLTGEAGVLSVKKKKKKKKKGILKKDNSCRNGREAHAYASRLLSISRPLFLLWLVLSLLIDSQSFLSLLLFSVASFFSLP